MSRERITKTDLQNLINRLNTTTGSPVDTLAPRADGSYMHNVGNYHVSRAYGRSALHRVVNEAGGCTDVLGTGRIPNRDLYQRIDAYLRGIAAYDARPSAGARIGPMRRNGHDIVGADGRTMAQCVMPEDAQHIVAALAAYDVQRDNGMTDCRIPHSKFDPCHNRDSLED